MIIDSVRYVRFRQGSRTLWGRLEDDDVTIQPLSGDPLGTPVADGARVARDAVAMLPPATPGKIIGVGLNYALHAAESGKALPDEPLLFLKPPSSLLAPDATIVIPDTARLVHHEAELAIVIGRRCHAVEPRDAADVILGLTAANDVSDRTLQRRDGQFTRGKGFDTFCPLGPTLVTGLEGNDLAIACVVNGDVRQSSRTSDMVFDVATIVSFVSSIMTLEPWDVILTGTPEGVGPLEPGDHVAVEIEGIGRLGNHVVGAAVPRGEMPGIMS